MTGTIYATGGKIGSVSIEALEDLTKTSRNMLKGTSAEVDDVSWASGKDYLLGRTFEENPPYVLSFLAFLDQIELSDIYNYIQIELSELGADSVWYIRYRAKIRLTEEHCNIPLKIELEIKETVSCYINGQPYQDCEIKVYDERWRGAARVEVANIISSITTL
jgi:hypothetical protein